MKFLVLLLAVGVVVAAADYPDEEGPLTCFSCEDGEGSDCHRDPWIVNTEICDSDVKYCEARELITENGDKQFVRGCNNDCWEGCWDNTRNETNSEGHRYVKTCARCCSESHCNYMDDMTAGATGQRIGLLTIVANVAFILFARFF